MSLFADYTQRITRGLQLPRVIWHMSAEIVLEIDTTYRKSQRELAKIIRRCSQSQLRQEEEFVHENEAAVSRRWPATGRAAKPGAGLFGGFSGLLSAEFANRTQGDTTALLWPRQQKNMWPSLWGLWLPNCQTSCLWKKLREVSQAFYLVLHGILWELRSYQSAVYAPTVKTVVCRSSRTCLLGLETIKKEWNRDCPSTAIATGRHTRASH